MEKNKEHRKVNPLNMYNWLLTNMQGNSMKEGQKNVLEKWISIETKINLYLNFKHYTKINSTQITHWLVKYKTFTKKKKNRGENLWDLGLSNEFLDLMKKYNP